MLAIVLTSCGCCHLLWAEPLSVGCSVGWSLTLICSLVSYGYNHWPQWRQDDNPQILPVTVASVLLAYGAKGFELT